MRSEPEFEEDCICADCRPPFCEHGPGLTLGVECEECAALPQFDEDGEPILGPLSGYDLYLVGNAVVGEWGPRIYGGEEPPF